MTVSAVIFSWDGQDVNNIDAFYYQWGKINELERDREPGVVGLVT